MNNCYRKLYPYSMYNISKNAKLGNVLVTWPCGVQWECNGGDLGGGVVGQMEWEITCQ